MSYRQPPVSYVLDVCRHCGALAKWPGCEHWQSHDGWTTTVVAVTRERDRNALRVMMNRDRTDAA